MNIIPNHEILMQRCLDLALCGMGRVAPNPMVGAILVHQGRIIGEGFHRAYGGPHAEIHAIAAVKDQELLKNATLYVNLEPCSHYGKTPPCTEAIIQHKIPRVVIGSIDPNPRVNGSGISVLRASGVKVITGVLQKDCDELNRRFFTFQSQKRPYVILKWAATRDGFLDVIRSESPEPRPTWITGESERRLVHRWRAEESSILVGTHTAILDNPSLNVRNWYGNSPLRLVLDRTLSLSGELALMNGTVPTRIFSAKPGVCTIPDTEIIAIDFDENVPLQILQYLYTQNVLSLIVEGGAALLHSFIVSGLWDEARVFTGSVSFGKGVPSPVLPMKPLSVQQFPSGSLCIFRNND